MKYKQWTYFNNILYYFKNNITKEFTDNIVDFDVSILFSNRCDVANSAQNKDSHRSINRIVPTTFNSLIKLNVFKWNFHSPRFSNTRLQGKSFTKISENGSSSQSRGNVHVVDDNNRPLSISYAFAGRKLDTY